jgi:hypothetical protein
MPSTARLSEESACTKGSNKRSRRRSHTPFASLATTDQLKVGAEHLVGNWNGEGGTFTAILNNHSDRDFRLIQRREARKPGVGVVSAILVRLADLRGSRLAGDQNRQYARVAPQRHGHEASDEDRQVQHDDPCIRLDHQLRYEDASILAATQIVDEEGE